MQANALQQEAIPELDTRAKGSQSANHEPESRSCPGYLEQERKEKRDPSCWSSCLITLVEQVQLRIKGRGVAGEWIWQHGTLETGILMPWKHK